MTNRTEQPITPEEDELEELQPIEVSSVISVTDLAVLMNASPIDVIKELMRNGYMFSINEVLEYARDSLRMPSLCGEHAT